MISLVLNLSRIPSKLIIGIPKVHLDMKFSIKYIEFIAI